MPRRRRTRSHSAVDLPSTSTSPDDGRIIPLISRSAVVLPDPLRPSSTSVSPASIGECQIVENSSIADAEVTSRNSTALMSAIGRAFRRSPTRRSTHWRTAVPSAAPADAARSPPRGTCGRTRSRWFRRRANGTVRSSAPICTSCAMRDRRCISTLDWRSF